MLLINGHKPFQLNKYVNQKKHESLKWAIEDNKMHCRLNKDENFGNGHDLQHEKRKRYQ